MDSWTYGDDPEERPRELDEEDEEDESEENEGNHKAECLRKLGLSMDEYGQIHPSPLKHERDENEICWKVRTGGVPPARTRLRSAPLGRRSGSAMPPAPSGGHKRDR